MNNNSFLLFALIGLTFYSCSPKIVTNVTKNYPPQPPDAPVTVYTKQHDVPPQSEPLGTVVVDDTGFTTDCDSITVFSIAKDETRKAGGNGFLLTTHSRPSFWGSTCHRIAGTMLLVSDYVKPAESDTVGAASTPANITFVRAQPANVSDFGFRRPQRQLPRMTLTLDAGYGRRTAKTAEELTGYAKDFINRMKSGFVWDASFNYFFNDYYGIGCFLYQFRSSHKDYAQDLNTGKSGELKMVDRITYIGPAFVMRLPFANNTWLFDLNMGFGYIGYNSKTIFLNERTALTGATVGFQAGFGLSYKFSPEWGIGFNLQSTGGALTKMDVDKNGQKSTIEFEENTGEGLQQISIMLGIRYYIK